MAKKVARFTLFIIVLFISEVLGWFALNGLLWIEFIIHVYTPIGKFIVTWGEHITMMILLLAICYAHVYIFKEKK